MAWRFFVLEWGVHRWHTEQLVRRSTSMWLVIKSCASFFKLARSSRRRLHRDHLALVAQVALGCR